MLDNYLVVSFSQATHLLLLDGEEMEDTQINGFELSQATLWAGNMSCGGILQVNPSSVGLILVGAGDVNAREIRWPCPSKILIVLSQCCFRSDCASVRCGAVLLSVEKGSNEIRLTGRLVCREEIACIDLSPIDADIDLFSGTPIEQVEVQVSSCGVLPRSLLIVLMDCDLYLLVGMGNGSVCYYRMNTASGKLTDKKVVTVGTQPVSLRKFASKNSISVYVCCDRPAVVYSSMSKLTFASVNLQIIREVTPLNSEYYKRSFVMADDSRLLIGTMDSVQKLHIRRVTLNGNVSRISYQPATNTLAILMSKCSENQPNLGEPESNLPQVKLFDSDLEEVHSVCILDANSFEVQAVFELEEGELGLSLISVDFDHSALPFYCVGTSLLEIGEKSQKGRIILFRAQKGLTGSGKLDVVSACQVSGSVYAIDLLRNKLVCGVGNSLQIFEWDLALNQLQLLSSCHGFTTVAYVKVFENWVLAGDMMRSVSLLTFIDALSIFKHEGRDEGAEWLTACEIVDSSTFLAAESRMNVVCCKKIAFSFENLDGNSLKQIGGYFLGESVNVLRRGSVSENSTISVSAFLMNPVMFGTMDGGFGSIFQIPYDAYSFLLTLQQKIAAESLSCIGLEHNHYRKHCTETRSKESLPFIDGDLLETLLDMPAEVVNRVVKGLKIPETLASRSQEHNAAQTCLALVCCTSAGLDKERCDLVRKLRTFNISADILHQPISSEAQIYSKLELCRQNSISFLLLLMERDEVLVHADESLPVSSLPSSSRSYSSYRIAHKRVSCDEAVKIVVTSAGEEYSNSIVGSLHQLLTPRMTGEAIFVSDIGLAIGSGTSAAANSLANVNINFAMDEKPPHNIRKKNEMQVRNTLSDLLSKLTPKTRVEVFVTDLLPDILRQLSSLLERRFNQTEFRQAFDVIFKQAGKQKSEVDSVLHSLSPFFTTSSGLTTASSVLILWCRPVESFYRVIV
uniref:DNA damage-binding protein 1 n=1 Tax=Ditylenchus dipsaci TaxID=166011 RepID=A0A915D8A9_9BILA